MIADNTPSSKQRTVAVTNTPVMEDDDVEYELMSAYVAGVIDSTSTMSVTVQKDKKALLGHTIRVSISLRRTQGDLIGVVDEWAMEHGIRGSLREYETEAGTKYEFTIAARDDVKKFLRHIQPFLVVKHNDTEIILNEVLPRLEDGKHKDEEGFIEIIEYAEMIQAGQSKESKYTPDYFRDLWADDL